MSPRQATTSLNNTSELMEGSSKSKGLTSSQRNSRRSNSAMSNTRTRGSVSKDESESDQQQVAEGSTSIKDETITGEPEEEEDDNGASGDSNNSTTQTNIRGRKRPGGKRRRGGAATAAISRTRLSRGVASNVAVEEGGEEETTIKSEAEEETAEGKDVEEDARPDSEEADSESKHTRNRSASGFKELAGLGLKSLGDGEGEPLVPRRTRRGAVSPNEGGSQHKGDDETNDEEEDSPAEGANAEHSKVPQSQRRHSGNEGQGEDETADEGVTRCLCGSADENVGLMIQCETCKCWQHCICMGMRTEEDCPDVYFCEQCRPELHVPLLRLLGVLPTSRNGKKNGSKTQSGRVNAKDAAKELKEAKEAVLTLAKENEKRRKDGREPVTGWSVAQEQEHQNMLAQEQLMQQQAGGVHRRQVSETRARTSRSQSGDDMTAPKSPPKRRSTMNSRDSAYGWESIPPGLLNEDEEGASKEDSEVDGRKRSRVSRGEDGERQSPSPVEPSSSDGSMKKRRRMSSIADAADDRTRDEVVEEDEEGAEETNTSNSQANTKKATTKSRAAREQESKPKHPNQYTARRAAAAAAAAAAAGVGVSGSSSPSPSPSKHRLADGSRKTTSLRDVANYDGQGATTMTPNGSQNEFTKASHPGTSWGMPDHLSHLAYLLPTSTGPEPLRVSVASTKGMPSASKDKSGHHSNAIKDSKTDRIIQASPQPFQLLSLVEPNTKIKFPGKRTTMGEMKKRVRNILEFVSRLQIESAERERRMKFLGITKESNEVQGSSSVESKEEQLTAQEEEKDTTTTTEAVSNVAVPEETTTIVEGNGTDTEMKDVEPLVEEQAIGESKDDSLTVLPQPSSTETLSPSNTGEATESASAAAAGLQVEPVPQLKRFTELHSTSMSLVDELTRELLSFQQHYGTGTSGTNTAMASSGGAF